VHSLTLKSRQEILQALKKATRVCTYPELEIRKVFLDQAPGKILIIIPKKVGNAPLRNKIRRRLKALFFENKLNTLPYNWIFFVKPGINKWSFQQLCDVVLSCVVT
jgi:ribonuclease P protein component